MLPIFSTLRIMNLGGIILRINIIKAIILIIAIIIIIMTISHKEKSVIFVAKRVVTQTSI